MTRLTSFFFFRNGRRAVLGLLLVLVLAALPLVVFADQVVNNIDTTIDPALETRTISVGGSTVVGFFIQPSNTIPAGDATGCNSTGADPAMVTLSVPAGVTASATSLTFTGCGIIQNVTFSSSSVGSHTVSIASVTGGKSGSLWFTAPAEFNLLVTPSADTTPPVITPSVSGTLGNNGWYVSNVTVSWTVLDPESAISSSSGCGSSTVNYDTSGVTFTCSATSAGGTNSQSVTIKRDGTAPTISGIASPAANPAGWNNADVTVSFTCGDAMSGVASCTSDQTLNLEGEGQSVIGTAVDNAGNSASAMVSDINIDKTAPSVSASVTPDANSNGWNNTNVTVSFSGDDGIGSGITSCDAPVTLSDEGAGQSASGTCTDLAGNSASATALVSIDKTAPTIIGSRDPAANSYGWNNVDVAVSFSCNDSISYIASCGPNQTFSGEAAGQSATGTAVDSADNSASTTVDSINIDKTAPIVAVTGVDDGGQYPIGSVPTAGCTTQDSLAGVATPANASTIGGSANGVGTFTTTCNGAVDKAGNSATPVSVSYKVIFNFSGFFQPVDMNFLNVAKAGSAIPFKFSLGGYYGLDIIPVNWPGSFTITCTNYQQTDQIEETVTAGSSSLHYDADANQYVYVWKTNKAWASSCRQFQLKLDDGTTHFANFKFNK